MVGADEVVVLSVDDAVAVEVEHGAGGAGGGAEARADAGEVGPAAALGTLVVLASVGVCLVYALATRLLIAKSQAWRA